MTPLLFAAIAVAGGIGATARMALDGAIRARTIRAQASTARAGTAIPWATMTINVSGSLVLGFLTGLTAARVLPADWLLVAGTGFLGGYTTFSTASYETVRLIQQGRWGASAVSGLGTLVAATAAAGLGLWLGGLV